MFVVFSDPVRSLDIFNRHAITCVKAPSQSSLVTLLVFWSGENQRDPSRLCNLGFAGM